MAQELAARAAELLERKSEFDQRIDHQSATIDVLKVMSASPGDPQPVFDLIVERARVSCGAELAALSMIDGDILRLGATSGMTAARTKEFSAAYPLPVSQAFAGGRAILMRDTVQVRDTQVDPGFAQRSTNAWHRSVLAVPLLSSGIPIGAIGISRSTPGTFSAAQVELLKTFAEQAVIAITSAETYRELQRRTSDLQEALEQQTATAEVLQVINSSPGDLTPVFDVILEKAHRLCGAASGSLQIYDGEKFRAVAVHGFSGPLADWLQGGYSPGSSLPQGRLIEGDRVAYVADLAAIDVPMARNLLESAPVGPCYAWPCARTAPCLVKSSPHRSEVRCSQRSRSPCWRTSLLRR